MWIHRGLRASTIYIVKRRCDQRLFTKIFHILLAGLIFSQNALYPLTSALPAPPPVHAQESPPDLPAQAGATDSAHTPAPSPLDTPLIDLNSPTTPNSAQTQAPETNPETTPESHLFNLSLRYPFSGEYPITYHFGERSGDEHVTAMQSEHQVIAHEGIDFGLSLGTEVLAVDAGLVESAGSGDYGQTVVVRHDWGTSYYGHLGKILVNQGDLIGRSHVIALSGNSGNTTGPHLHFGVKPKHADLGNGYHGMIDPELYLLTLPKKSSRFTLANPTLTVDQRELELNFLTPPSPDIEISLTPPGGNKVLVTEEVLGSSIGPLPSTLELNLTEKILSQPGQYTLTVTYSDKTYQEQDFYWGVLAMNLDKPIYRSGEKAGISFAVLDEMGEMVCDASLTLTITSPTGIVEHLTTASGTITLNHATCSSKDYTLEADYQTSYTFAQDGIYIFNLDATTINGSFSIKDQITVAPSILYDLSRTTVTRVFPLHDYPVYLHITPQEAYQGLVTERVPLGFTIKQIDDTNYSGYSEVITTDQEQLLTWQVDWQAGTTYQLGYTFDAPNKSPQLYHLGPLRIGEWMEGRQWSLAIDAVQLYSVTTSTAGAGTNQSSFSYTVPSGPNRLLVVMVATEDTTDADRVVSSVTWNTSENLTEAKAQQNDTENVGANIWYLINPTTTTANVVVNFAGSVTSVGVTVTTLLNASQTNVVNVTGGSNQSNTTSPNLSVTTTTDYAYVISTIANNADTALTSTQTERSDFSITGARMVTSTIQKDFAGSQNMGYTAGGATDDHAQAVVAFKAMPPTVQRLGSVTTSTAGAGTTSTSFSYTVPAYGNNKALVVAISTEDITDADRVVNSITWNTTQNLVEAKAQQNNTDDVGANIWYLLNPVVTTANIVITYAGAVSSPGATALTLVNIDQFSPLDVTGGANQSNTATPNSSVSPTFTNTLIMSINTNNAATALTSTQEEISDFSITNAQSTVSLMPGSGTGSHNIGYTAGGATDDHAQAVVVFRTSYQAIESSFQRKTWYDGTRYWRSYYDTTDQRIEFEYSTTGSSWTENTNARISSASSADFSLDADNSNAFVVYKLGHDIAGSKATSYPGTSFSWGSEQTILDGASSADSYSLPVITRDSSSYVWVAAKLTYTSSFFMQTIKEAGGTNDLPEDSADTLYSLGNSTNASYLVSGDLTSLSSQNMYLTFVNGTTLLGCKWVNASSAWQNSSGSSCQSDYTLLDNLLGHWTLDEAGDTTRQDSSSRNNDLVESASDTVAQVTGQIGSGADFERADTEYLEISDANQSSLDLSQKFSFASWINVESTSGLAEAIVSKSSSSTSYAWGVRTSGGNRIFVFLDSDGTYDGDEVDVESAAGIFSTGTWAHFAVTYDGSTVRLYKNGTEQTSGEFPYSVSTTINNSSAAFRLGQMELAAQYYDGILDEVRIYNEPLSSTQITNLYNYAPITPDTIDTLSSGADASFSSVGDGSGNIYTLFVDDETTDQISSRKYNGTTWAAATLVADVADNNDGFPTISYDSTGSDLYSFWIDNSTSDIYYSICDVASNCDLSSEWSAETAWITTGTNSYVTSNKSAAGYIFAEWLNGETVTWDKVIPGNNTAPDSPTSLAQKTTSDVTLATGDWHNTTNIKFTATATDTDNPDTLQLCVEKDLLGTSFSNTEDSCGTGVSYSGTGVSVSVTISSQTDASEYHWQARVKDTAGTYSAWVAYGGNAESARDYGIDTTAPTGGTVYDGTGVGVDTAYNDGSLSSLSANWDSFNSNVSGLSKYQYSIGTTAGATDVRTWTDNSTTTSVTATSLTLQTSQMYYVNVRAVDTAGNTGSTVSSNGQRVAPSLNFTVSPGTITFGNLNAGNSYTDTEDTTLTTTTNAYNGYVVRAFVTDYLRSQSDNFTIPDFSGGTYAAPATWGSSTGLGYTSSDTTIQGSNLFSSGTLYAPFSHTGPGDIVADHTSLVTGTPISAEAFTITYKVAAANTQPAHKYTNTVVYTITAQY